MANNSGKVIQFPSLAKQDRIRIKEAQLDELSWENSWLHHEIEALTKKIDINTKKQEGVLKELAVLCDFEPEQDDIESMPDFGIDFDLTEFNPEEDK